MKGKFEVTTIVMITLLLNIGLIFDPVYASTFGLDKSSFNNGGWNETRLHIAQPGSYHLKVTSSQGTKIDLIDRMKGTILKSGVVGKNDGDGIVLLDKGTYKIRTQSPNKLIGEIKLVVTAFKEGRSERVEDWPLLKPLQLEQGSLLNLQQQSFWIQQTKRKNLKLEAIGRSLATCRLWQYGHWQLDVTPRIQQYEPTVGRPMTYIEFNHELNPGWYRLTCYGTAPLAWANDTSASPFYVRLGIPELGTNGRKIVTISPFGRDVLLLPKAANFFQLRHNDSSNSLNNSNNDKTATTLRVTQWVPQSSRHQSGQVATIDKKLRDPQVIIRSCQCHQKQLITLQGQPGDSVVLDHFVNYKEPTLTGNNNGYWISSLPTINANDALDVTAFLTHADAKSPLASQVIKIDVDTPMIRTINLLGATEVFIKVQTKGTYHLIADNSSSAQAEYQLTRFFKNANLQDNHGDIEDPDLLPLTEHTHELLTGFYRLRLSPKLKGVLTFALIKHDGVAGKATKAQLLSLANSKLAGAHTIARSLVWPHVKLAPKSATWTPYRLLVNDRFGVNIGFDIRPLPMNLKDPLPVWLAPGQSVPIDVVIKQKSKLRVTSLTPSTFSLMAGSWPVTAATHLAPGRYIFTLTNTDKQAMLFTLAAEHPATTSTKLAISTADWQGPLPFRELIEDQPVFTDFARLERQQFTFKVGTPGFYRLETSGRLAMSLTAANRMTTKLYTATNNGIGRNALITNYFNSGTYLVTAATMGRSRGRAGIHLRKTPMQHAKNLQLNQEQRVNLAADTAIMFDFDILEKDHYHLQTLGLGKSFASRLEDAAGWPILTPGKRGDISTVLTPGRYRFFSLPEPLASRRLIGLQRIITHQKTAGKGPHVLALNQTIEYIWQERADRSPDLFSIDITAPVDVTLSLSKRMQLELKRDDHLESIVLLTGGRDWQGELLPGQYQARVQSIEKNDGVTYTIGLQTDQLIPGSQQTIVQLPTSIDIRVGTAQTIELHSSGTSDVKAFLCDEQHRLLDWNDDQDDDWNFRLSQYLLPGKYTLQLSPVGRQHKPITVTMQAQEQERLKLRTLPFKLRHSLQQGVLHIPFQTNNYARLVHLKTNMPALGLAVYKNQKLLAKGEIEIFIPLEANTQYDLHVWRLHRSTAALELSALELPDEEWSIPSVKTTFMPQQASPSAIRLLRSHDDVAYQFNNAEATLLCNAASEIACRQIKADLPVALNDNAWLVVKRGSQREAITINPMAVTANSESTLEIGATPLVFDIQQTTAGPLLLEASFAGGEMGAMTVAQHAYNKMAKNAHWFGAWRTQTKTLMVIPGPGSYRGKLWRTKANSDWQNVVLRTLSFIVQDPLTKLPEAEITAEIAPGHAKRYQLQGDQAIDLVLGKNMLALVWHNDMAMQLIAAIDNHTHQKIAVTGGVLILLNRGDQPALYRLQADVAPLPTHAFFAAQTMFERSFSQPGKLSLALTNIPKDHHLFVAGDHVRSLLLGANGILSSHDNLSENDSLSTSSLLSTIKTYSLPDQATQGFLQLDYQPGYVQIWHAPLADQQTARMGQIPAIPVLPLKANVKLLAEDQLWSFSLSQPTHVNVAANTAGTTALYKDNKVVEIAVSQDPEQRRLSRLLAPGDYLVWTRPLVNNFQQGELLLTKTPPFVLDEAQSSTHSRLIHGIETHVFQFAVLNDAKVGVGLQTDHDNLLVNLYDSSYQLIGSGALLLRDLTPGNYFFTVAATAPFASPIQYKPILLGTKGRLQGVPNKVLQQYLAADLGINQEVIISRLAKTTNQRKIEGSWINSGGQSATSEGNPHYHFNVVAKTKVVIDLTSATDSYLYLLDADKQVIDQNDDGGGGKHARIVQTLLPGTYTVIAATYGTSVKLPFTLKFTGSIRLLQNQNKQTLFCRF